MNIVHELNQLDYGGVERIIRNLAKFDSYNKHTVVAYNDGSYSEELEKVGITVIIAPKEKDSPIDTDCDIIHIHCGGAVSAMAAKLGKEFPVIETIHSPVRSPNPSSLIRQRVGVTDAVARINPDCMTIRNGLDFSELETTKDAGEIRGEFGIQEGKVVIGRLGRLGYDKGLEEWLLACHRLQRDGVDFVPLIVGDEARNASGYRGKLKLMAASLPVKGVVWSGFKKDIANYLQIMDVFLYPSPTEGFGLVFVEAMYCGAMVVAYNNDVTMEIAGGYSILTEKSIAGLVTGVKRALQPEVKQEISLLAQDFVKEEYDAENMARQYGELYGRVFSEFYQKEPYGLPMEEKATA